MAGTGPAPHPGGPGVGQSHGRVPLALGAWGQAECRERGDTA